MEPFTPHTGTAAALNAAGKLVMESVVETSAAPTTRPRCTRQPA